MLVVAQVAAHEQFFHTYFSRRRDVEEKKAKKGPSSTAKPLNARVRLYLRPATAYLL